MTPSSEHLERLQSLERGHFWSLGRDRLVDNLIVRYAMAPPFVDAGAGTGAYARRLSNRGQVIWLDVGPVTEGGVRADMVRLPLPAESVGTLLARDVLEHIDDQAALAEAHRVLKPGGHLVVTVPGWPSLWGPRDEAAGHLRRYRRGGLRRVVEASGFEVLELRGYQFILLPVLFVSRVVARIRGDSQLRREEQVGGRLNRLFTAVNQAEAWLARRRYPCPPTGSSLVLIGRRT